MGRRHQPTEDGYIECDGCGHPFEDHNTKGCQMVFADGRCDCTWETPTQAEIRRARVREGLPAEWWQS